MPTYGGQYYPAASPGPPIQTTASNKGPDGANLFIFHIPNHFTNVDMYQLFYPYGNLLSVRIMVEKDTGRSRGFGFVSYDSPDAAAWAIKELNGYSVSVSMKKNSLNWPCIFIWFSSFSVAGVFLCHGFLLLFIKTYSNFKIGNKRLKVQHKQIRPSDQAQYDRGICGPGGYPDGHNYNNNASNHHGGANYGAVRSLNLPPSGPMAASVGWYNNNNRLGPNGPPNGSVVLQDPTASAVVVAGGLGEESNQPYVGENPADAAAAGTTSPSDTPKEKNDAGQEGGASAVVVVVPGSDPLSKLEPLRQALPDVGNGDSAATSAAEGEI
jgi:RNA recognition motif-containing protein